MICVIGSHAINKTLSFRGIPEWRTPKDLDIVATEKQINEFTAKHFTKIIEQYPSQKGTKIIFKGESAMPHANIVEAEVAWRDTTAAMLQEIILADPNTIFENGFAYASLDVCYVLKMSHRYLKNNPHFLKTMSDIHKLRILGASIKKKHAPFLKAREKSTYWYKHPKLNKNKMDFFNGDGVKYLYDHDAIHQSVKIGEFPAYSYFQSTDAEVMCDMKKFFELPEQIRLNAVYEESCVLALERSIIPFGTNYKRAFHIALEKVCTSITSGKFREFAWEHYAQVYSMFRENTFDKFFDDVRLDKVDKASSA